MLDGPILRFSLSICLLIRHTRYSRTNTHRPFRIYIYIHLPLPCSCFSSSLPCLLPPPPATAVVTEKQNQTQQQQQQQQPFLPSMARSLSLTLTKSYLTATAAAAAASTTTAARSSSSASHLLSFRPLSSLPNNGVDLSDDSSSSTTDPLLQKLEDAIHRIIVRRAAPDWLPFLPGSSYWVPPPRSNSGSSSSSSSSSATSSFLGNGIAQLVEKLAHPLTQEQSLSTTTLRGWPSADYFIKGAPSHALEAKTGVNETDADSNPETESHSSDEEKQK